MPNKFVPPQTTTTTRTAAIPLDGEILYDTDEKKLYYGDGTTVGGKAIGSPTVTDNVFRIQDNSDNTKQLAFETSSITTGTTRTLTVPDSNGTVLSTDTLTDKALYYYDASSKLFKPVGIGILGQTLIAQPESNPPYQWSTPSSGGREVLTADRTYYVRTDGSDSNNGLTNTAEGAFLTIQKAIDTVCSLDLSIYNAVIQIGAGTYNGKINLKNYLSSGGRAYLKGDISTPVNVVLDYTTSSGGVDAILDYDGGVNTWIVGGFTFASTNTNRFHIRAWNGASLQIGFPVRFLSTNGGTDIFLDNYGKCFIPANYEINGTRGNHIFARVGSICVVSGTYPITVTLSNSANFSTSFVNAQRLSLVDYWGFTLSGSASGNSYNISSNSVVFKSTSVLPGNGGTVATGGQYV